MRLVLADIFFLWPPRMAGKNQSNSASQHKRIFSHACQHVSLLVVGKRPQGKKRVLQYKLFSNASVVWPPRSPASDYFFLVVHQ